LINIELACGDTSEGRFGNIDPAHEEADTLYATSQMPKWSRDAIEVTLDRYIF